MEVSMVEKGDFTKDFDKFLQDDVRFVLTSNTVYDDGNEEYIVLLFDFFKWVENTDNYKDRIEEVTLMLEEVMEADCFQGGDHACTLDKVTHGNSTIIALITCCK